METQARTIEISRNGRLGLGLGALAALLAVAFLVRASGALDLGLGLALAVLAAGQLYTAWDARVPLLIADLQGVRMRLGRTWAGLPWSDLDEIEHLPRSGWLSDGRLVLLPHDEEFVVSGLSAAGRRQAAFIERLYGAPFVVPLGLTTRVSGGGAELAARLADLAHGVTTIVEIDSVPELPEPAPTVAAPSVLPAAPVAAVSAEARRDLTVGANALATDPAEADETSVRLPEDDELHHAFAPFDGEWSGHAGSVEEDGRPAEVAQIDPVVGPVLAAARERLGLSLDQLSQRTRIRARIIAAVERDDFAACGGDFYARGHLRTLARVLGLDVQPLLEEYDERYADAPVDPRRVFESELATTPRPARSGPNWSVLVAAVMSVVLLWSIARLVFDGASPVPAPSIGLSSGSAGTGNPYGRLAPAVPVVLTAAGGGAQVVVRDAGGNVVFSGNLAFGESKTIKASPPVRIQSTDGSLTVAVSGAKAGAVGETGVAGQRIYAGPHG